MPCIKKQATNEVVANKKNWVKFILLTLKE